MNICELLYRGVYEFRVSFFRVRTKKAKVPQVQVAVCGRPVARGRMADRGRAEADAVATPACRTSGPCASARARHRATGRPGRVQASASVARLTVRGSARRADVGGT